MAGPIKISVLADVGKAARDITHFSDVVEENTNRVVTGLGDSKLTGSFGKAQEAFDVMDTRAMGFRDTITGVQDSMTGFQALMGQGAHASDTFGDKLLLLGTGVGDLASGFANFLLPMMAIVKGLRVWTGVQWALNVAMSANPLALVIIAIVALVAIVVVAYKKSETFRAIVQGAFRGVLAVVSFVVGWVRGHWPPLQQVFTRPVAGAASFIASSWRRVTGTFSSAYGWVKGHWPLLLAILTGPVGLAVRWIVNHFNRIPSAARAIPGQIRSAIGDTGRLLFGSGQRLISGFVSGITSKFGAVQSKLSSLTSRLPVWKGPLNTDEKILHGSGRAVIDGFTEGLQSGFNRARSKLRGFTSRLRPTVDEGLKGGLSRSGELIPTSAGAGPAWARRLIELLDGGITLRLESSGHTADDALLEMIRERVTARGGKGVTLGITS
jgi:phage-related protein